MAKRHLSTPSRSTAVKERPGGSRTIIGGLLAVAILAALIGFVAVLRSPSPAPAAAPTAAPAAQASETPAETPAAEPTEAPAETPEPTAQVVTEEELAAQEPASVSVVPPDTYTGIAERSVIRRDGFPLLSWDVTKFAPDSRGRMTYSGEAVTRTGIDVSEHQGVINWSQVAASGVDFAMIRAGYRGSTAGGLYEDEYFKANISGARSAGLEVGVYFYSQAINVQEAREEAKYVLDLIEGCGVTYPVVFDWEIVGGADARTYSVSRQELCACTRAFCDQIRSAGYDPMIYFTRYLGYRKYMLRNLADYGFWYAEYEPRPRVAFDFDMWQYSDTGSVAGVDGNVDLNIYFVRN